MLRRDLIKSTIATGLATAFPGRAAASGMTAPGPASASDISNDRSFWLEQMHRVAHPVLSALSQRRLRTTMPVEKSREGAGNRGLTTHLEAFARTLAGIAPWLENGGLEHGPATANERELRTGYLEIVRQAIAAGVDPKSPDYLQFGATSQTLVDAGFFSLAVLRAPQQLNAKLDSTVRAQLADALRATRPLQAHANNWLLFAAGIEAALFALGQPWERTRVDYALREHMQWYVGDGAYGDGPHFHWDYYNSFVIQPFLLAILETVGNQEEAWKAMIPMVNARASRYAHILERLIAPDGTYPVIGRSIPYRGGAFQLLADVALRHALPEDIAPEQVRCALSAVLHRTLEPPGTFDKAGWLQIGLAGHQPNLGEGYISTGSLYLCSTAFLPLGLPPEDRFWSAQDASWSAQKLWRGDDMISDHAIDI
jgi:hypothetical protein